MITPRRGAKTVKVVEGKTRYRCRHMDGARASFLFDETDWGHVLEVKQPVSGLAMNGSGICGTTWGLRIRPTPVIEQLKKNIVIWNPLTGALESPVPPPLVVGQVRTETDEIGSGVIG